MQKVDCVLNRINQILTNPRICLCMVRMRMRILIALKSGCEYQCGSFICSIRGCEYQCEYKISGDYSHRTQDLATASNQYCLLVYFLLLKYLRNTRFTNKCNLYMRLKMWNASRFCVSSLRHPENHLSSNNSENHLSSNNYENHLSSNNSETI